MENKEIEVIIEKLVEQVTTVQISIPIIMETLIGMLNEQKLIDKDEFNERLEKAFKETYEDALKNIEELSKEISKEETIDKIKKGNIILN